jgi:hypothetical protein
MSLVLNWIAFLLCLYFGRETLITYALSVLALSPCALTSLFDIVLCSKSSVIEVYHNFLMLLMLLVSYLRNHRLI